VVYVALSSQYAAVATIEGSLYLYSKLGRRLCTPLALSSPAAMVILRDANLLVLQQNVQVQVWNLAALKSTFGPISFTHLLEGTKLEKCNLTQHGLPIIQVASGCSYTFNTAMQSWARVSDPFLAQLDFKVFFAYFIKTKVFFHDRSICPNPTSPLPASCRRCSRHGRSSSR